MSAKTIDQAIAALQKGDLKQATALFDKIRKKLTQPHHLHACTVTYLQSGRPKDAQKMLKELMAKVKVTPQLLSLSGDIHKAQDNLSAAIDDYRRATGLAPQVPELHYNLALTLFQISKTTEAKATIDKALKIRSNYPKALVLLGRCLASMEQFEQAEQAFNKAIKIEPNSYLPHYRLGRLHVQKGNSDKASESLGRSLQINKQLTPARESLILNSIYSGNHEGTINLINTALKMAPHDESIIAIATDWAIENGQDDPYIHYDKAWRKNPTASLFQNFITALISSSDINHVETLLSEYETTQGKDFAWESAKLKVLEKQGGYNEILSLVKSSPHQSKHQIYSCLGNFALGHYGNSYKIAERLHRSQPTNQYYLALLATALRCLGDPEYDRLANYHKLVFRANLETQFENYSQFTDFRKDLIEHLNEIHVTRHAPLNQSVRGGTQTPGNLFAQSKSSLIHTLKQLLANVSEPFFEDLKSVELGDSHPIISKHPDTSYFHTSWSIRTSEGGFHKSHIHLKGWYSSACYIDVPDVISDESDAGYLVLGKPPFKTKDELHPDYSIKPEAGSLVLFPSYIWHATQPYKGAGNRLVVAFDVGAPNLFV